MSCENFLKGRCLVQSFNNNAELSPFRIMPNGEMCIATMPITHTEIPDLQQLTYVSMPIGTAFNQVDHYINTGRFNHG